MSAIDVSGTIVSATWTAAESPVRVVGAVTVPTGNVLTIAPGVDILFDADVPFVVEGTMRASGTAADSIRFLAGIANEWGGIRISGDDSSAFAYVRISGGHADGMAGTDLASGGGMSVTGIGTRISLAHVVFSENRADENGGGLAVADAAATLLRCTFAANSVPFDQGDGAGSGGGAFLFDPARAAIDSTVFAGNSALSGGGLALNVPESDAIRAIVVPVRGCLFTANTAYQGAGLDAYLGNFNPATSAADSLPLLVVSDATFEGNAADALGGGAFVRYNARLERCAFRSNSAQFGGGARTSGTIALVRCTFVGNAAESFAGFTHSTDHPIVVGYLRADSTELVRNAATVAGGGGHIGGAFEFRGGLILENTAGAAGGMLISDATGTVSRTVVAKNEVPRGKAFSQEGLAGGIGVVATDANTAVVLDHCTIAGNSAGGNLLLNAAGVGVAATGSGSASATATNSIIYGNSPDQVDTYNGSFAARYSDIQGGRSGVGNIDADPLFVDPATANYALSQGSPAIGAGDPASPPDPDGTRTDMGAIPTALATWIADGGHTPRFALFPNAPNPFNPATTIRFSLAAAGPVLLTIHDATGRLVRVLVDDALTAGGHEVAWDGVDATGRRMGSGAYVYLLRTADGVIARRMVLVR